MIRQLLVTALVGLIFASADAQVTTATNFTGTDCGGNVHNLFNELDSGKVVVLNWVMPCSGCIGPTQTSYDLAQSYSSTYPGKVLYYLIDDYGNTSCPTLGNWLSSNIVGNKIKIFSDSTIHWSDFGAYTMPKIVVVGPDHLIYYNDIGASATAGTEIQAAIDAALGITGIKDFEQIPVVNVATTGTTVSLNYSLATPSKVILQIYDAFGRLVTETVSSNQPVGSHRVELNVDGAATGLYFMKIGTATAKRFIKFSINI